MIIENRKICEIDLTTEELNTLARARDILEQIVDFAKDEEIAGFEVPPEYDDFYLDEFSNCVSMLDILCRSCSKLVGFFDEE